MKILVVGADWIIKYAIAQILLDDTDGEADITVVDQTASVEDFFHFPPLAKYSGDERIIYNDENIPDPNNFDTIIFNSNIIEDAHDLFKAASAFSFKGRIIVISSGEVYGWQGRRQIPFDEFDTPTTPTSIVGRTKLEIEKIARKYDNLNVVILRLSTIFGPYMPEESELIQWLKALLTQQSILIEQPAARAYDLCYVTNVIPPIVKAMTADLPKSLVINIGSADSDWKTVRERGKDVLKPQIFEKHVVEALLGLRVLLDSRSKIEINNEGVAEHTGKGYHSQLKTGTARKLLDYFPAVDTMRGCLQTAYWLQKSMELDMAEMGRAIEDIYPTLDDNRVVKVGQSVHEKEQEYEIRKAREKQSRLERSAITITCPLCEHVATNWRGVISQGKEQGTDCKCHCHDLYREYDLPTEAERQAFQEENK